ALNNAAISLNVIGNNIANINTTGFKQSSFSEELKKASGSSDAATAGISQAFVQGDITTSTNPLAMAISGNTLFQLFGGNGISYTRNGQFSVDQNNNIVDSFGNKLQGYSLSKTTDTAGNTTIGSTLDTNKVGNIQLNTSKSTPKATATITIGASLNSGVVVIPDTVSFDSTKSDSYDNSKMTTVYDALGNSRTITNYFRKQPDIVPSTGNSRWNVYTLDSSWTTASIAAASILPNTLEFNDATGKTNSSTIPSSFTVPATISGQPKPAGAITFDFAATTQGAGSFSVNGTQDGNPSSDMTSYKVNSDGTIAAVYADGSSAVMAQVVLAKFNNLTGLSAITNNQWKESSVSGKPQLGTAGKNGFGTIRGGSVESSNVDLTIEMVKLISAQRAFQSAAEVVKKQDEIVQTINRIGG
ncbi:MAG: flagellar hook protein FlgE, partial [Methylococcaceae bacterium]